MKINKLIYRKKTCRQCPYTIGLIHTVVNPCPQCMLNGYKFYEWFQKQLLGVERRHNLQKAN